MLDLPEPTAEALRELDAQTGYLSTREIQSALERAVPSDQVPPETRDGWWAESVAHHLDTRNMPDGGPWGTYFQPFQTVVDKDGNVTGIPNLLQASKDTLTHWEERVFEAQHPCLAARYADLVWDVGQLITSVKPDVRFAHRAIDCYLDAPDRDDGDNRYEVQECLDRALRLSLSLGDSGRTARAIDTTVRYFERTEDGALVGTCLGMFDILLPPKGGPSLADDVEAGIVSRLEGHLATLTELDGDEVVDPMKTVQLGSRLTKYYERRGRSDDRRRVLGVLGKQYEKASKIGDATRRVHFLTEARELYTQAGLKDDAERMQREAQDLSEDVKASMASHVTEIRLTEEQRLAFVEYLDSTGDDVLKAFAVTFIKLLFQWHESMQASADDYPLMQMFKPSIVDESGIAANVDDTVGDPDGEAVFELSQCAQYVSHYLRWGFDHLIKTGAVAPDTVERHIADCPMFEEDRYELVRRGVAAHIAGDYVYATHVLIPVIERALVRLAYHTGGSGFKRTRGGRAATVAKSLNDVFDDARVREILGDQFRLFLLTTLAHPKGHNIRNAVCHGRWSADAFGQGLSERVLHVILALGSLRRKTTGESDTAETDSGDGGTEDEPSSSEEE